MAPSAAASDPTADAVDAVRSTHLAAADRLPVVVLRRKRAADRHQHEHARGDHHRTDACAGSSRSDVDDSREWSATGSTGQPPGRQRSDQHHPGVGPHRRGDVASVSRRRRGRLDRHALEFAVAVRHRVGGCHRVGGPQRSGAAPRSTRSAAAPVTSWVRQVTINETGAPTIAPAGAAAPIRVLAQSDRRHAGARPPASSQLREPSTLIEASADAPGGSLAPAAVLLSVIGVGLIRFRRRTKLRHGPSNSNFDR